VTRPASGSRFPELDNRDWWILHGSKSDTAIAGMLGCHRDTVRAARRRNGVPSLSRGRARGSITVATAGLVRDSTEVALLARIQHERARRVAPTEDLLVARIRAAHDARQAGDPNSYDDALLGISSAAALIHEHRMKLRRAA
jgi:hypothetical protein